MSYRAVRLLILSFIAVACILTAHQANATHIRAGEIIVQRKSCSSLVFTVTITVYTNTGSIIRFSNQGLGELNFGDGSPIHNPPQKENNDVPGFGPEYGYVSYSVSHVFPGPGQYIISYFEHNRNDGIQNMSNSVNTPFYVETVINIDPFLGCDNSPQLLVPPIDKACSGAAWYHNPGAFDPDGDSISFEMTIPKQNVGLNVGAYQDPNAQAFYVNGTYGQSNEAGLGPPTFSINPVTGTIIWDAPGQQGEYNIAFVIKEWRKVNGQWVLLGYVTRDMQIEVEDCLNQRPELTVPMDICVEAGTTINATILGFDPDLDSVKLEAFSQVFSLNPSPATYTPFPPVFKPCTPDSAKLKFHWATKCEHIKEQPYQVVFKITDRPPQNHGAQLVQFKTWNIRVVGPAPIWNDATLAFKKASLSWDPYLCGNASTMQIWRRIDSNPGVHAECETGMPASFGYKKIAEVPISQIAYLDTNDGKGLAPGAVYCYRLVAAFPLPEGGESYVSTEVCLPVVPATAPVLTNVTIDKTDPANGIVTVKWRPPFDLNPGVYPPPYSYEIYRADGFSGLLNVTPVNPGKQTDTTLVDVDPLNTRDNVYNYRVVVYDNTGLGIDTSSTASTVRLELSPSIGQITLDWAADVPWSNQIVSYPMHWIYRGNENDTESQLVLIDSVNVLGGGFRYVDQGQYNGVPLNEATLYCYRVMTKGGYGNPKIKEPLLNFSEIICAQPNDSVPPCKPKILVSGNDCSNGSPATICGLNSFSNTLTWDKPSDIDCLSDTRSYNIYIARQVGEDFDLYATKVTDNFFVDSNLPSYARCYKISAVDRSGNESELSDAFCFDNCPYYELPNVFTPNGDNCNELFSAYHLFTVNEEGSDGCSLVGADEAQERANKCARYVYKVSLTVVNRWGKEVYTYESGGENSILIDWDGRDNHGKELPPGSYYYAADVDFIVVDPAKQHQKIKGWVQLIR